MDQTEISVILVGMAVVTYLPRFLPILFLSGKQLSPLIVAWLRLIPPAILSALLIPGLFCREQGIDVSFDNLFLYAACVAFPVAIKTKSLSLTVLIGMGVVALGRYFGFGTS